MELVITVDFFGEMERHRLRFLPRDAQITVFADYLSILEMRDVLEAVDWDVHCTTYSDVPITYVPEEDARVHIELASEFGECFRAPALAVNKALLRELPELGFDADSSGWSRKGRVGELHGVTEAPIICDVTDRKFLNRVLSRLDSYDVVVLRAGSEIPGDRHFKVVDKIARSLPVKPLSEVLEEADGRVRAKFNDRGILTEREHLLLTALSEVWRFHSELVEEVGDRRMVLAHLASESFRNPHRVLTVCKRLAEELGEEYTERLARVSKRPIVIGALRKLGRRFKIEVEEEDDRLRVRELKRRFEAIDTGIRMLDSNRPIEGWNEILSAMSGY
ncbi:hypothetical protein [Methanopyrus sp.]